MSNIIYHVGVSYLDGFGHERYYNAIESHEVYSFKDFDEAVDKVVELCLQNDKFTEIDANEIKSDICEHQEKFDRGKAYRVLIESICDCDKGKTYIGPGAITIKKERLQ